MAYIGNSLSTDVGVNQYEYTATSGQTDFACVYDTTVDVYLNGVRLAETDYSKPDGLKIVLAVGATAGDIVTINAFENVATISKAPSDFTVVGDLDVGGDTTITGKVGIGTSSPAELLHVNGGNIKTDAQVRQIGYWEADAVHDGYFVPYNANGQSELVNSYTSGSLLFKTGTSKTERMRIDSSGRVTMPYQPAFIAEDGHNGTTSWVSLPDGTYFFPSGYANVSLNRGNHFNGSTGTFTAPVNGFYMFVFNTYTRGQSFGDHMYKSVNINGSSSSPSGHIMHYNDNGNADNGDSYTYQVYLSANDSIKFGVRPVSSNNDMQIYAGNTYVSGQLIG